MQWGNVHSYIFYGKFRQLLREVDEQTVLGEYMFRNPHQRFKGGFIWSTQECSFQLLYLASQDALEVMGVTHSVSVSTDLTDVSED